MKFIPYQKIPTDTNQFDLSKKENNYLFRELQWVVLEKVNGANFSIYCNGIDVKFAKRTAFIGENEWFYSFETISESLTEQVMQLYKYLKSRGIYNNTQYIILYGELFGGFYPSNVDEWTGPFTNKRINKNNECILPQEDRAIQEGIYYSPNIEFVVLDICIVEKLENYSFLNYDLLMKYCTNSNLNYLEPLFTGVFTDCINFNYKFDSKVAVDICKQKKLPSGTNVAEGVVIKPIDSSITIELKKLNKNETFKTRPLVKLKHPQFLEISGDFTLPTVTSNMILSSMVNINRLNSLRSKLGELAETNIDQILELFIEDIMADYYEKYQSIPIKNYDDTNTLLYDKSKKLFTKYFQNLVVI